MLSKDLDLHLIPDRVEVDEPYVAQRDDDDADGDAHVLAIRVDARRGVVGRTRPSPSTRSTASFTGCRLRADINLLFRVFGAAGDRFLQLVVENITTTLRIDANEGH